MIQYKRQYNYFLYLNKNNMPSALFFPPFYSILMKNGDGGAVRLPDRKMQHGGGCPVVRYGFIHSKEEIMFLILFAMDLLPFPISFDTIVDLTTWCDEGFGYFELSEAFCELLPTGHIKRQQTENGETYSITEKGREAARIFEKQLPYPVREAAQRSALRVVRQIRRDAAIRTEVTTYGEHDLMVRMEMDQVFAIEMNVVSRAQADMLERHFKANAEAIFQKLLTAMTSDYQTETDNNNTMS